MVLKGVTGVQIAKEAQCSHQFVSFVIRRKRKSPRVEALIASALGLPVEQVFPKEETDPA